MKIDRIWDLLLEMDESGDVTGRISYGPTHGPTGRMTVTLDGRRIMVYVEEVEDE